MDEADQLADGFRLAVSRNGLSEDEVREHALGKLARTDASKNPIAYLINAFTPEHLDRLRPAGTYEPLAGEPLALPGHSAGPASNGQSGTADPASTEVPGHRSRAWCGDCTPVRSERGPVCSSTCSTPWYESERQQAS